MQNATKGIRTMADVSVTIMTGGKTWADLKKEVEHLGVPDHATFKLYAYKSYNPVDWDAEKIVFSWKVTALGNQ